MDTRSVKDELKNPPHPASMSTVGRQVLGKGLRDRKCVQCWWECSQQSQDILQISQKHSTDGDMTWLSQAYIFT